MARAISYFIFSSNGSYLRWDDDTTIDFRIRQYEMSITGGGGVDRLYVGPGTKVDAGALFASANTDELYLSGNFNDYTQTISAGGVYTFTGLAGGSHAGEVVSFSMNSNGDKLVFANGHITVKSSDYLSVSGSYSSISAGSLTIVAQTDPTSGAEPGNKPAKVFVFDAGGINIPQLPIVDEAIAVSGGGGVDKFYVRKGTNADAIGLFASAGQDVLYLTGRFGDYTQTKSAGGVYTFTRNFTNADASLTEVVSFSMNSSGDQLVFADGGVTLRLADYLTGGSYANITFAQLNGTITTPGLLAPTPNLILASDTGSSASDRITNNATINVTGLVTGGTWQYQMDGTAGSWTTGTASSFTATSGAHTYLVRQFDIAGNSSVVSTAVTYTLDNTAPVAPTLRLASDTGSSASDGLTNNVNINVDGLETGATWQYQVDGSGSWMTGTGASFTASTGTHSYSVRQTDAASNTSAQSTAVTYTLDNILPSAPTLRLAVDTGSSASDSLTNNPTILVNGLETITGTSWQYQVDGTAGSWMTGTASSLIASSGPHTYFVRQIDAAGNTSAASTPVTYTLDNTLPTVNTTTFNVEENTTAVGTLAANETVTWSLGSGADTGLFTLTNGVLSFTTAPNYEMPRSSAFNIASNNDAYTVNVTATDTAGNVKTQAIVVNVTDVNEAPTVVAQTPTSSVLVNQAVNLNVASAFSDPDTQATDATWRTLSYAATGLPSGLSINTTTGVIGGTATATTASAASVTVTATDGGGRSVTETFSLSVVSAPTLSTATPPSTALTGGGNSIGDTIVLTITFDGVVNGLTSGTDSTIFKVAGTGVSATWSGTTDTTTRTLTYTVAAGQNGQATLDEVALKTALVAGISDAAGNAFVYTANSGTIANIDSPALPAIDGTAPATPSLTLASDTGSSASDGLTSNVTINVGGLETGATWQYQVDNGTWATGTASSFTASAGAHSYLVRQTDAAGNTSTPSTAVTYTLDTSAPTVNTTSFSVAENSTAVGTLAASETVTWSLGTGADTSRFGLTGGVLSFSAAPNFEMPRSAPFSAATNNNIYTVNVNATDAAGNVKAQAIVVNVTDVNEAPALGTNTANQTGVLNQAFTLNVSGAFSDPDSVNTYAVGSPQWGTVTYTATGLPTGLVINAATGAITGTITGIPSDTITSTAFGGVVASIVNSGVPASVIGGVAASGSALRIEQAVGNEGWAGVTFATLAPGAEFINTANKVVTVKVYAPAAGLDVKLKFEDAADYTNIIEKDVLTTGAGWQELTFDFSTVTPGTAPFNDTYNYNKASIFLDFLVGATKTAARTFYVDDIAYKRVTAAGAAVASTITFDEAGSGGRTGSTVVTVTATDGGSLAVTETFTLSVVSAPVVQSFTVSDTITANGTQLGKSGEALVFVATMSEAVTVVTTGGTPSITFSVNGVAVTATYASGSNSNMLTFTGGTVPATGNGTAISITSIALNGGTVTGQLSNQAWVTTETGQTYAGYTVDNTTALAPNLSLASDTGISASDDITNNATIKVQGLEANATWQYQVDGTAGAWTNGSGSSFTATSGAHSYFVRQTDAAGNTSAASVAVTYTLDSTPPSGTPTISTTPIAGDGIVSLIEATAGVTIQGTGNANTDVTLTLGRITKTVTANAGGAWSMTLDATDWGRVGRGAYTVAVTHTDAAGNVGTATTTTLTVANDVPLREILLTSIAAGRSGFAITGEAAGDVSGYSVSAAGDVNGDGLADLLVGALGNDAGGSSAGRSYVVFGRANTSAVNLSAVAAGTGGFAITGEQAYDQSGFSVSAAGDINGDGLADLLVGAPQQQHWNGSVWITTGSGRSYVVFGKTDTSAVNLSAVAAGTGGFAITGEATDDYSGYSVSAAGDVNGDGLADLLVGAPVNGAGRSYVVFGKANTSAVNLSAVTAGTGGFAITGEAADDQSGSSVSAAGDVNGDGLADLLVGAPVNGAGGSYAGRSYVVFGKTDTNAVNLSAVAAGTGGFAITGEAADDYSGYSVSAAGDVNGDGLADLLVGAPVNGAGRSYVVFGKTDTNAVNLSAVAAGTGGFAITGEAAGDWSGLSVSAAGDVNGDGLSDLLVGAPQQQYWNGSVWITTGSGCSHVVFGKTNTSAVNLSAVAAGTGGFAITGEAADDYSGYSVSAAGDINGDGLADLLVGAPYNDAGGSYAGRSYVIFGGTQWISNAVQGSGTVTGTSAAEAIIGSSGEDVLTGSGGVDRFFGGAGNDVIVLTASDITNLASNTPTAVTGVSVLTTVDGGTGIDTIRLIGGANLDLTAISNTSGMNPKTNSRIASIEGIDLATDTAANTLSLRVNDVLDMAGFNSFNTGNDWTNTVGTALSASVQKHQLVIDGTALDTLALASSEWVRQSDTVTGNVNGASQTYNVYINQAKNAMLLVDADIVRANLPPVLQLNSDTGLSANDGITNNATIVVTELAAGATWSYQVDSTAGAWITGTGSSFTATSGAHSYFVRQIDAAGNTSAASTAVIYTLDTTPPSAPTITTPIAGDNTVTASEASAGVSIQGTAEANASVTLTLYQVSKTVTANASGAWSMTLDATDWGRVGRGVHILTVATAPDLAGNVSVVVTTTTLTVANDVPLREILLTSIAAGIGGFAITGEAAGDSSGYSVSAAGDVNGDGLSDLLVGAPYSDWGGGAAGRSYVVYGKTDTSAVNLMAVAAGTGGFAITGEANFDLSGSSVSAAGDINGDGLADLLVGAWGNDAGGTNAGRSYVVFGKTDNNAVNLSAVTAGTGGFAITGESSGDGSGYSVSAAGDVNGDGLADLLVGAPYNVVGGIYAGRSYVVFGKANTSAVSLSAVAAGTGGFAITGEASRDYHISVSVAGDMNGDGMADLLVGARYNGAAGVPDAGRSYVVFGKANTSAVSLSAVAAGTGGFAISGAFTSWSGENVSAAGDVNGDGLSDLLILASAANRSYVVFGKTNWLGVSTLNLSTVEAGIGGFVITGEAGNDWNCTSVSAAGDVNGDGLADLLVGASFNDAGGSDAGRTYLVFGKTNTSTVNLSTIAAGTGGFAITGEAADDQSGYSVSAAGDINGDGLADLLVGTRYAGRSYVIFGGTQWVSNAVQGSGTVTGTSANEAIIGSSGADVLTGGGGVDRFFGGAGNDVIVLTVSDITNLASNTPTAVAGGNVLITVDGGTGIDTIRLIGGANLDLTTISNTSGMNPKTSSRIASIERIDLATDTAANTLSLRINDVLDMAGFNSFNTGNGWTNATGTALSASVSKHQLVIDGLGTGVTPDKVQIKDFSTAWTRSQTVSGTNDIVSHTENGTTRNYYVYNSVSGNAQLLIDSRITPMSTPPEVASFTVSDTTTANGARLGKSGEPLVFVATMSEAVTVVTTGGTPSITFSVNGVAVTANYASGSGTNMLTFTGGTVPATGNGTAISITSIALNGGTVTGNLSTQGLITASVGQTYAGYTVDNTAPTVNTTSFSVAENTTAVGTLAASETVTWSLGTGADTLRFGLTGGVLSFSAAPNFEMPRNAALSAANSNAYTVNVNATDTAGNVKAQAIVVNVTDVNEAPALGTNTANQTGVLNQAFTLNVASAFSDPDSVNTYAVATPQWGTLTYTATGLPTGLVINAATGAITGTITGVPSDTITSTAFGGVVASIVNSGVPASVIGASGSALRVEQAVGNEGWAGVTFATLAPGAEFINTANKVVTVKVYAPAAGLDVKLKFEDAADYTNIIEKDVLTTGAGWQELTFDFSTVTPGTAPFNDTYNYNKASIFLDFLVGATKTAARTFYVDDIAYKRVTAAGAAVASTITFDEAGSGGRTGSTVVTVTATDGGGLAVTETFNLSVVSALVVQSFTVSDTTTANGAQLGKSGEALVFVATMSEAVTVDNHGMPAHSPSITFSVNGQAVTATYASGSNSNMLTFTGGTVPATGNGTAISITSIALNGGTVTGNLSAQAWVTTSVGQTYAGYTVDNTLPTVNTTTFNVAENTTAVGTLAASETVTWSLGTDADTQLFNLVNSALSFKAAPNYEAPRGNPFNASTNTNAYTVNVMATDAAGNVKAQAIVVNISDVNEAPVAVMIPARAATQHVAFSYDVSGFFSDPDTQASDAAWRTLTYTATGLPSGLTIADSSGVISGMPSTTTANPATVTVTATDGFGLNVTETFTLSVVDAPVISNFTVTDNTAPNHQVGKSGDTLTFVVTMSEAVTVVTTDGTPSITFSVNGQAVTATYASGSNSTMLTFSGGTVPATGEGTAISVTSIALNSGTVTGNSSGQSWVSTTVGQSYGGYTVDHTAPLAPSLTLASDTGSSASDGLTSNVTINVGGLESGATWQYQEDGSDSWMMGTASSFTASIGTHSYLVRQTDAAGNTSDTTATYTFDTSAPATPSLTLASDTGISASDNLTSNATINVSGLESGATWQYRVDNGTTWVTGTASSFTASEGTHSYLVRQTDAAGNTSATSAAVTYGLVTSPTLTLASDTGISASDSLTSNATINVSGLESGATWQYQVDNGTTWVTGTASSFTANEGTHSYLVRQTNAAGNTSAASSAVSYTFDTSAPATPTLMLASDTGISASDNLTSNATINVSGLESGATWQYQVDNGTTWVIGTASSFTASEGTHSYLVRQTDAAGNTSTTSNAVTYTFDTTVPTVNATAFNVAENTTAVGNLAADETVTWSLGTGADTGLFTLTNGVLSFTNAPNFEMPRSSAFNAASNNDAYTVNVTATDTAGNVKAQAIVVNVTDVNEAPTVIAQTPASSVSVYQAVNLNVASAFSDPDNETNSTTALAGKWGTLTYSTTGLPSGLSINANTGVIGGTAIATTAASVTVTATDGGGSSVTETFDLRVGNIPALATVQTLYNVGTTATSKPLDVRSALVISFNQVVTFNDTGTQTIKIMDDMGTAGLTRRNYQSTETVQDTFDNDVVITLVSGVVTKVTVGYTTIAGVTTAADYSSRFDLANSVKLVTAAGASNLVIDLKQKYATYDATSSDSVLWAPIGVGGAEVQVALYGSTSSDTAPVAVVKGTSTPPVGKTRLLDNPVDSQIAAALASVGGSSAGAHRGSAPFDWDFGANYHVELDAGLVKNSGGLTSAAVTDATVLNFKTVTPYSPTSALTADNMITNATASNATGIRAQSVIMDDTGASNTLTDSFVWLNGNLNQPVFPVITINLAGGKFAVVQDVQKGTDANSYYQSSGMQTYIQLQNFGVENTGTQAAPLWRNMPNNDILYLDNHGDQAYESTDGRLSTLGWSAAADAIAGTGRTNRALNNTGTNGGTALMLFDYGYDGGTTTFGNDGASPVNMDVNSTFRLANQNGSNTSYASTFNTLTTDGKFEYALGYNAILGG